MVDVGLTLLHLPKPTDRDTGGYYSLSPSGNKAWVYSPIDLLIAGIQSVIDNKEITNLGQWFKNNPKREADSFVSLSFINGSQLTHYTVAQLHYIKQYHSVLKKNAPFTFY